MLEAVTAIDVEAGALAPGRFDRILVVIDDPNGSPPALLHAIDLAIVTQGTLICAIVICSDTLPAENAYRSKTRLKEMRTRAGTYLKQMTALAAARGLAVEGVVVEGVATDAILEAAAARRATSIVIGAGQRRVLERLCLGGASDHVLRRSRLPVTVVRG